MRPEEEREQLERVRELLLQATQLVDDPVAAEHLRDALAAVDRRLATSSLFFSKR